MTREEQARWLRVKEIFSEAWEAEPGLRETLIGSRCGEDAGLAAEVQALLELREQEGLAVDRPAPPVPVLAMEAPPPRHNSGEVAGGRYRIEHFVSSGGMGEVYAATDQQTGERVAIKFMHTLGANRAQAVARFRREVELGRSIVHPNVCVIRDFGGLADEPFCVMDFLTGETLAARIASDGPFGTEEARVLALQICDGLAAAHGAGVIHRDLKPGNIFLVDGRAVIIDFGLAAIHDHASSLTSAGAVVGTIAYMAPELLEGAPASFASDIYALGVILYEMLTGEKPYAAKSPLRLAVEKAKPSSSQARFGRVAPVWDEVIRRCLQADAGKRFPSAGAVREVLERGSPSLGYTLRRPVLLWPVAGVVLLVAGWAVLTISNRDYEPGEAGRVRFQQAQEALMEAAPLRAARLLEPVTAGDPGFINAWALLAVAYAETDQIDKARDAVLQATAASDRRWRLGRVERHSLHAARGVVMRDYAAAVVHYRELANTAGGADRLQAQLNLGRILEQAGKTEEALATFEAVVAGNPGNAAARLRLALLLSRKLQGARAAGELARAEAALRDAGNLEGYADLLLARAAVLRERGIDEEARDLEEVVALSLRTGDTYHRIAAQFRLASIAERRFQFEKATAIAREATELARRENMPVLAAQAMSELGYVFVFQRLPGRAVPILREAVAMAERAKGYGTVASARMRLGEALAGSGEAGEAVAVMRPAIEWYRQGTYDDVLPFLLVKWGTAHSEEGFLAERIRIFEEALALAARNGDEAVQAMALQRLANTATYRNLRQAAAFNERALPLARKAGNHGAIHQAAGAWRRMGDLGRARELYEEAARSVLAYPEGVVKTVYLSVIEHGRAMAAWQEGDCVEARRRVRLAKSEDFFSRAEALQIEACVNPGGAGQNLSAAELLHGLAKDDLTRAKVSAVAADIALRAGRLELARRMAERGIEESLRVRGSVIELENSLLLWAVVRRRGEPLRRSDCGRGVWSCRGE